MKSTLRIPRILYDEMRTDLSRDHAFAAERVGCLFAKMTDELILAVRYLPLPDEMYENDYTVGAKFGSAAIRLMMQKVLDTGEGAFIVHQHCNSGLPRLSKTDEEHMLPVLPSLQNVGPKVAHGAIILSNDAVAAWMLFPSCRRVETINKVAVVGFPVTIFANRS